MSTLIECTGYSIAADLAVGDDSEHILLVLHGYHSSKTRQQHFTQSMKEMTGTSTLAIDLSGHGESPFELRNTRPAQHFLEVICAFDWIEKTYPHARISVSGSSYGGFLAVQLTKYRKFDNLILRAPAIYTPSSFYDPWSNRIDNTNQYDKKIAAFRKNRDTLAKHPLLGRAASFEGRTLVVVHEDDETIPRETTDAYIHAFSADSFVAPSMTHSIDHAIAIGVIDESDLRTYEESIAKWLKQ